MEEKKPVKKKVIKKYIVKRKPKSTELETSVVIEPEEKKSIDLDNYVLIGSLIIFGLFVLFCVL